VGTLSYGNSPALSNTVSSL